MPPLLLAILVFVAIVLIINWLCNKIGVDQDVKIAIFILAIIVLGGYLWKL